MTKFTEEQLEKMDFSIADFGEFFGEAFVWCYHPMSDDGLGKIYEDTLYDDYTAAKKALEILTEIVDSQIEVDKVNADLAQKKQTREDLKKAVANFGPENVLKFVEGLALLDKYPYVTKDYLKDVNFNSGNLSKDLYRRNLGTGVFRWDITKEGYSFWANYFHMEMGSKEKQKAQEILKTMLFVHNEAKNGY